MWRIYSIHNVLFILHRVTGLALLAYLLIHIGAVSSAMLAGPGAFDRLIVLLSGRGFFALELLLFACLLFHGANGLRLILAERGVFLTRTGAWARATVIATLVVGAAAGLVAIGG